MPKAPASRETVESIKDNIIDEAVSLINEGGYADFSMRKLGSRLGIAAKTIYNYFSNRDELYLKVVTRGFEILHERMSGANSSATAPFARIRAMAGAYVQFGLDHPHHYNIMFSMDLPKYADYIGTEHQELAAMQNETALQTARLAEKAFRDLAVKNRKLRGSSAIYHLMRVWATLHGIVSLHNSRVTLEVGDFRAAIDYIIDETMKGFR